MTNLRVWKITATKPPRLSKRYKLDSDGTLQKQPGGALVNGRVEPVDVEGLQGFADLLQSLTPSQALTYGGPAAAADLVTKEQYAKADRPHGAVPRANSHFVWQAAPGVLMLDHDPADDAAALTRDQLVSVIRSAVPGLADAAMLWWPSSSSHIANADTGEDLTGLRGQRLYIAVADASDIPRAGEALVERLWAAGYGWFTVSKSGARLERTIIDAAVWQPSRLDFAAGAATDAPLRQDRGEPVWIDGTTEVVDTATAIPDPDAGERATAETERAKAKAAVRDQAEDARETWIAERVEEIAEHGASEDRRTEIRAVVERAVNYKTLAGDFTVEVFLPGGSIRSVSIAAILDDPTAWHGLQTKDPLEPDYDGGRAVGKLYTVGARPCLHSFAHGGTTFRLTRAPAKVELVKGRLHDAVLQTLEIMRRHPDVFDFGGSLVRVEGGEIAPLDRHSLAHWLGGATQYWKWVHIPNKGYVEQNEDPPARLCEQILSLGNGRRLRQLEAVVTAPTMRPGGTVLDTPGYDQASGLLFETTADPVEVPRHPSVDQAAQAYETLIHPFRDFPLATSTDWTVLVSALLTAVVRPALPTAPAFAADAPVQGSGKTLLMSCVAALGTGERPTVWPHTSGDDDEIRKRLFTALRHGSRGIVWDNVTGVFDSASLAAALTSSSFTDRVLGKSEAPTIPNRALFLLTGNNLSFAGDLPRRILSLRIDPETDRPFAREFDLDPLAYVQEHRQQLAAAALTLIRAYLTSGAQRAGGRMASFEAWDDLVRQTVYWAGQAIDEAPVGDPMDAVDTAQRQDPEQETLASLVQALSDRFGEQRFTARDVLDVVKSADSGFGNEAETEIASVLRELAGRNALSAKSIGRIIQHRRDRIVNGMRIQERPLKDRSAWSVVKVVKESNVTTLDNRECA
jgi:hypothetical protein